MRSKVIYNLANANPAHLDIDSANDAIYWINSNRTHFLLLCTFFDGTTRELYAYPGSKATMEVAVGESDYVYVLDKVANQIDRFNKTTGSLKSSISIDIGAQQLTLFGG